MTESNEVWTIGRILKWAKEFLKKKGFSTYSIDSEVLLSHVLEKSRLELYLNFEKPLEIDEKRRFGDFLRMRQQNLPIAYIVGYKDFMDLRFCIDQSVLIPRPDTETLIDAVENDLKEGIITSKQSFLDIGTGSGCIAVSLAHRNNLENVAAWDLSRKALGVAQKNADLHLQSQIRFSEVQALDPNFWPDEKFDVVVSNPPYICSSEVDHMASETREWEPEIALYAEDEGLAFYQTFANNGDRLFAGFGHIYLEVGFKQADSVVELLKNAGWSSITKIEDYSQHDRVVKAIWDRGSKNE